MRLKSYFIVLISLAAFNIALFAQEKEEKVALEQDSLKIQRGADLTRAGKPKLANRMDSKEEVFYSNAPMFVAKNTGDKSSMLILGTAKFDNEAQISQKGETALTGDFISMKKLPESGTAVVNALFLAKDKDNNANEGIIKFSGEYNKQEIVRRDKDGALYSSNEEKRLGIYVLDFPKIKVEKDNITKLADIPVAIVGQEAYTPEKFGFVSVNPNVAMSVGELDITKGNRLSISVSTDGLLDNLDGSAASNKEAFYKMNSAYVNIKGLKNVDGVHPGYSEVDMNLYKYDPTIFNPELNSTEASVTDDDLIETNTFSVGGFNATFLRGFTSPFDKLHADYMFYNVLTTPTQSSITDYEGPVADPHTQIIPGAGYFFAMEASNEYFEQIQGNWHTANNDASKHRSRGGYNFSRLVNEYKYKVTNDIKGFNLYTSVDDSSLPASQKTYQRFNTGGVEAKLVGVGTGGAAQGMGVNYLANPFMTPINVNGILGKITSGGIIEIPSDANRKIAFDIRGVEGTKAVYDLTNQAYEDAVTGGYGLIRAKYWVVNTALVAYTKSFGVPVYAYNVKYDNIDYFTTPTTMDRMLDRFLEPMQIFMVQVANSGTFKFTDDLKTLKGIPFDVKMTDQTSVPRSSRSYSAADEEDSNEDILPDWFVMQAVSDKKGSMSADRAAIRFYNNATIGLDAQHDVKKAIMYEPKKSRSKTLRDETISPQNVIYTATPDKTPLLANAIGYGTKEVPLFYLPGDEEENVTFTAFGIDGFEKVEGVWLIDRHMTNQKPLRLEEGTSYSFISKPSKETQQGENRFILRFYEDDTQGPSLTDKPITCYYSGSTLHIGNLNEKDLGSLVQIYDLQGRLMGNTTINSNPSMEYYRALGQGTFIVKITGERNYTTKFVNLQNY